MNKHELNQTDALRRLIGRHVRYMGKPYEITDLLLEEGLLILSAPDDMTVQDDSYGRPCRMVRTQQHLCFRDSEGKPTPIWDELIFLDGPLEQ